MTPTRLQGSQAIVPVVGQGGAEQPISDPCHALQRVTTGVPHGLLDGSFDGLGTSTSTNVTRTRRWALKRLLVSQDWSDGYV